MRFDKREKSGIPGKTRGCAKEGTTFYRRGAECSLLAPVVPAPRSENQSHDLQTKGRILGHPSGPIRPGKRSVYLETGHWKRLRSLPFPAMN